MSITGVLIDMGDRLFMAMSRRRISCPLAVQQLWDAVKVIRFQRQVPDIDRITKYMTKVHNMPPGKPFVFYLKIIIYMTNYFVFYRGSWKAIELLCT